MVVLNETNASDAGESLAVTAGVKAVVFAGGQGSRLAPLVTEDVPKSLLPVANRPALFYSLIALLRAHIDNITVVTSAASFAPVSEYLKGAFLDDALVKPLNPPDIAIHESAPGDDTADVLRELPPSSMDYLVLSGDIVGDVGVHDLIRHHQLTNAVCTTSLHVNEDADTYVLTTEDESRLLGLFYGTDLDSGTLGVPGRLLKRFPRLRLRKDVADIHAYVLSAWTVEKLLEARPAISSVRYDLVPYLARRYLKLAREKGEEVFVGMRIVDGFIERVNSVSALLATNIAVAKGVLNAPPAKTEKSKGKVKPAAPKLAKKGDKTNVGVECAVGACVEAGDRTSVKKSVLGDGVILGKQVKLNGCVVGKDAEIADGCNLNGTFVSEGSTIEPGCKLKDCTIAPGVTVPEDTEASGRAFAGISNEEDEDDIDLGDDITFE